MRNYAREKKLIRLKEMGMSDSTGKESIERLAYLQKLAERDLAVSSVESANTAQKT